MKLYIFWSRLASRISICSLYIFRKYHTWKYHICNRELINLLICSMYNAFDMSLLSLLVFLFIFLMLFAWHLVLRNHSQYKDIHSQRIFPLDYNAESWLLCINKIIFTNVFTIDFRLGAVVAAITIFVCL